MKGKEPDDPISDSRDSKENEPRKQRQSKTLDPWPPPSLDIACLDDLTGLGNRRFLNRLMQEDWKEWAEQFGVVSLILIDLDGFKEVNDTYGHATGDQALRTTSRLLRKHFREGDIVIRHGGDEFLIALAGAGPEVAAALADRARRAVDSALFMTTEGKPISLPMSFSVGVASYPEDGRTGPEVLDVADRRLYSEKRRRASARSAGVRSQFLKWGAALVLAIAVAATFWLRMPSSSKKGGTAVRKSVAVLGFKNLSGSTETAWLSTAFAEMLSTDLAAGGTLRVIPGESVARARTDLGLVASDAFAADTIGRVHTRLGTDVVVSGSYLEVAAPQGSQVRLDVRLQDAASGEVIGVVSQTGKMEELLDLVARTGAQMRKALGAAPLASDASAAVTAALPGTTEAARLYAEGLDHLRRFDAIKAQELLEKATAADPNWPLAYSALAEAWITLGYDSRARDAARRAFELSTSLPREDRLLVEGRFHETASEWSEAVRVYDRLFRFVPDNLEYGLSLARAQRMSGNDAAAASTLDALRKLPEPLSGDPRIDLAAAEATKDHAKSRDFAAKAAQRAQAQGARLLVARARLIEAWSLGEMGKYNEATAAAEEARNIYTEAGDKGGLARALNRLATVRPNQSDLLESRSLLEESARLAREVGDRRWTAYVLNNLAITYSDAGDPAAARPIYEEALKTAREVDAQRPITIVLTNLGRDSNSMGRPREGVMLLKEALEGYRALGDHSSEVYALNNMGNAELSMGNMEEARKLYEQSLPISQQAGEQRILGYTLLDLGDIQYWQGNLPAARKWYEQSLALRQKIGARLDVADTQLSLARLAIAEGKPQEAEHLAIEAFAVFAKEQSATEHLARAILARALVAEGRVAEASKSLAPSVAAAEKMQLALVRLAVKITQGEILSANRQYAEAIQWLQKTEAEADDLGLAPEGYEAQLALLRAKLKVPQMKAKAQATLSDLAKDAEQRGFKLVAQQAHKM